MAKYTQATKEAQARYRKSGAVKGVYMQLNTRTDADIIDHLQTVENKQGYIKGLIRADIAR